ncbi:MAG: hypothetical protein ACKPAD_15630 [Bacteroidota bacterium]
MNPIKLIRTFTFSVFVVSMMMITSCAEEGAEPDLPGADRDKSVGSWLCKEFVNGSQVAAFTINIQKIGQNDSVKVSNFSNVGSGDYAIWLISGNSITIPAQTVAGVDFGGTGFYSSGDLDLNYTSDTETISALCTSN